MKTKSKNIIAKIFSMSTFSSVILLFVWELLEELIEEGIAWGISTLFFKTLSILGVVGITQGIKFTVKKLIKIFTYSKGKDKTNKIKKLIEKRRLIMKWLKANKYSIMYGLIVACISGFATALTLNVYFSYIKLWLQISSIISASLVGFVLTFLLGKDTVLTYLARLNAKKLGNEEFAKVLDYSNNLISELEQKEIDCKNAKIKEAELEKARKTVEEYEKAKKLLAENT